MEIKDIVKTTNLTKKQKELYQDMCEERCSLAEILPIYKLNMELPMPDWSETKYEVEQTKTTFPEEWKKLEQIEEEMKSFSNRSFL